MEQLNQVLLRGVVGQVRKIAIQNINAYQLQVATNVAYKDQDGCAVIETSWHNVTAWDKGEEGTKDLSSIAKGDKVTIRGRLRNCRYTNADGQKVSMTEILAFIVTKIDSAEVLEYQML